MISIQGLSKIEVDQKLLADGFNEIPGQKSRGLLKILFSSLKEPMIILLISCASIYLLMGEAKDGAILLCSVFIVLGISLYQERKSEKAIDALKELSSPRALVIRDGKEIRIAAREVVVGDLLIVSEGDRIPADSVLISTEHFKVDESLLTGESLPVTKLPNSKNQADSLLFSGTLAVAGRGLAKVVATGSQTQLGRIGKSLLNNESEDKTLLQRDLSRLTKVFGSIGLGFSLLIVLVFGLTHGDWPQGLLVGLAAAMSLLPEEFPVVLSVFLAMGAWRISKKQVLTRRISATENLGSITVLCVDKTGTLTKNQMEVRILDACGESEESLINSGALASHFDSFDPMDKAIQRLYESERHQLRTARETGSVVREYPLSHQLMAMTCVWKYESAADYTVASKGAPEAILELCQLSRNQRKQILGRVQSIADQGLRVLGAAIAEHPQGLLPNDPKDFAFRFAGLIAFEDPIRPEIPEALRECYGAGIRVIMMTGDYAGTARSIARQIGLSKPDEVITGDELRGYSDLELRDRIKSVNIFARMIPEQKLRVIHALKANSEIVAMTGDGVNDAPSLKWADVGIAMGKRGTDVAREAASMVLLDDNFSSIVAAIKLGRRIFDNVRKAIAFILAVHVPIAGIAMLPVLFGLPPVLFPAHIVFLELVIDPASALIFEVEEEEPDVMKRLPRSLGKPLFGAGEIIWSLAQGGIALVSVSASYWFMWVNRYEEGIIRSTTFLALVLCNLGLIFVNQSISNDFKSIFRRTNRSFVWLTLGTLTLLALILSIPDIRNIFHFSPLNFRGWICAITSGVLTVFLSSLIRRFSKNKISRESYGKIINHIYV